MCKKDIKVLAISLSLSTICLDLELWSEKRSLILAWNFLLSVKGHIFLDYYKNVLFLFLCNLITKRRDMYLLIISRRDILFYPLEFLILILIIFLILFILRVRNQAVLRGRGVQNSQFIFCFYRSFSHILFINVII